MSRNFAQLCLEVSDLKSQLCVGLDPSPEILRAWGLAIDEVGLRDFSLSVVESAAKHVGFIKPQVAFFEAFGSRGFEVLEETIQTARNSGLFVIADAKRGDIGSTMAGYAKAWFAHESKLQSNALTVSGYLGVSSLYETAATAAKCDGGIFVLAATSNPEAEELQSARLGNTTVSNVVLQAAKNCPSGNMGVVIGATRGLESSDLNWITQEDCAVPILAPGFGAQGASLTDIRGIFGQSSRRVIASVSRAILRDGKAGLAEAISNCKNEL